MQHKKITNADKIQYYTEALFDSMVDECSVINEVAEVCELITSGTTSVTKNINDKDVVINLLGREMFPLGQGVRWKITEVKEYFFDEKNKTFKPESDNENSKYKIEMFNDCDVGYRFYLDTFQLKKIGQFLSNCCEYMLKHGEPI